MAQQRITLGLTGQTLRHVPIGRVTGATYIIEDLAYGIGDASRTIASGSATVASWSLTTDAVCGATQRRGGRIPVAATTGASVGDPAVIVAADGRRELFEVAAIASGDYIEAAGELSGEYASGSSVYGVQVSCSVPNDFASNDDRFDYEHPLRVTWVYTLDGREIRVPELIEFVRSEPSDQHIGAAVLWVRQAYPDASERLPDGARDLTPLAVLMADEVAADLRDRNIQPEQFMTGDRGRRLLVARLLAHLGDLGYAPGSQDVATWRDRAARTYREQLDGLTIGRPGAATAEPDRNTDTASETKSTTHRGIFARM